MSWFSTAPSQPAGPIRGRLTAIVPQFVIEREVPGAGKLTEEQFASSHSNRLAYCRTWGHRFRFPGTLLSSPELTHLSSGASVVPAH